MNDIIFLRLTPTENFETIVSIPQITQEINKFSNSAELFIHVVPSTFCFNNKQEESCIIYFVKLKDIFNYPNGKNPIDLARTLYNELNLSSIIHFDGMVFSFGDTNGTNYATRLYSTV